MSTPKFITKEKRDTIKEKLVEEEEEQRRLEMEAKAAAEVRLVHTNRSRCFLYV